MCSEPVTGQLLGGWPRGTSLGIANSVKVVGDRAYAAVGPSGLAILDVSDSTNVRLLGRFATSAAALCVDVVGDRVYVGEQIGQTGPGTFAPPPGVFQQPTVSGVVEIVDTSNPANLRRLDSFNTSLPVFAVQVVGNLAYVVGGISYRSTQGGWIEIFDVTAPADKRRLGTFSTGSYAVDLQVVGKRAYVRDWSGFQMLEVSDPTNVRLAGTFDTLGEAHAVHVAGDLAFVANGASGLQVIRLTGGPGFLPGFLAEPQSSRAPLGATITLQASAAGTAPLRYQWRKDGVDLLDNGRVAGSATPALTINRVEAGDFGSYSVAVSNHVGNAMSAPAVSSFDERFQIFVKSSDLPRDQGRLTLRISGVSAGETVVVLSSVDLLNWLRGTADRCKDGQAGGSEEANQCRAHPVARSILWKDRDS